MAMEQLFKVMKAIKEPELLAQLVANTTKAEEAAHAAKGAEALKASALGPESHHMFAPKPKFSSAKDPAAQAGMDFSRTPKAKDPKFVNLGPEGEAADGMPPQLRALLKRLKGREALAAGGAAGLGGLMAGRMSKSGYDEGDNA